MQTYSKVLVIGEPWQVSGGPKMGFIEVTAATGTLTFNLSGGGTVIAIAGDLLEFEFDELINGFTVTSTVNGDAVELRTGAARSLRLANSGGFANGAVRTYTRADLVFGLQHGTLNTLITTQIQVAPPAATVTRWYFSLDPAAAAPIRVGASNANANFGRWVLPGQEITGEVTEDAGGTPTLTIYNPGAFTAAYTIQSEYFL